MEKISQSLILSIILNDEEGFVRVLKANPHFVMTVTKDGQTPLHVAVLRYYTNQFFMRYLLTYPPTLVPDDLEDADGNPALFLLASYLEDP